MRFETYLAEGVQSEDGQSIFSGVQGHEGLRPYKYCQGVFGL